MQIALNLVGVFLAIAFLLFMAIYLNELPLYFVCGAGVVLLLVGFWQDEIAGRSSDPAAGSPG